jgi:hypothetical protein
VIKYICVLAGFVFGNLVANLAVDIVVGEMVSTTGDNRITALAVVSGLPNIDIRILTVCCYYDIYRESPLKGRWFNRE